MRDFSQAALVIVGHGSTVNPDSSAPTHRHAETIRRRGIFREVHVAFWKEEPSLRDVWRMVDCDTVFVTPNFISEGYFTREIIPRELGLSGPLTHHGSRTIHYAPPVGSHPRMTDLLLKRARAIAPGVDPAATSLFVVGHGTNLHDNSAAAARDHAARIAARGEYAEVLAAYMEEPPYVAEWDRLAQAHHVVVVPFFISDGLHSYEDIPVLLGIADSGGVAASQAEVFRRNPHHIRERVLYYAGAIGTDPEVADLLLAQAAASLEGEAPPPQGK